MRRSYDKYYGLAQIANKLSADSVTETTRYLALFGALEIRYIVSGIPTKSRLVERLIWADLLPFLYLDKVTGREALAEYIVYKEMPTDANISWLETVVQRGNWLAKNKKDKKAYNAWMPVAKSDGAVWLLLLEGRGRDYFWV